MASMRVLLLMLVVVVKRIEASGQRIGSEAPSPYLSPELTGQKLLVGANFASAGIGILNDTGIQFVGILRIFKQLALFQQYQQRLSAEVGAEKAQQIVKRALVLMTLGGNDFVNNYFLTPFSLRSQQFTIPQFCNYLITEYKKFLLLEVNMSRLWRLNIFKLVTAYDKNTKAKVIFALA
ncbi:unnamed protein product [Lupinus luteus]|uniref:GDSL esterase/lipase n=1 Tax=Lupinus luteus TaxID=3873 RepID=A0AAV1WLC1_LUPLU